MWGAGGLPDEYAFFLDCTYPSFSHDLMEALAGRASRQVALPKFAPTRSFLLFILSSDVTYSPFSSTYIISRVCTWVAIMDASSCAPSTFLNMLFTMLDVGLMGWLTVLVYYSFGSFLYVMGVEKFTTVSWEIKRSNVEEQFCCWCGNQRKRLNDIYSAKAICCPCLNFGGYIIEIWNAKCGSYQHAFALLQIWGYIKKIEFLFTRDALTNKAGHKILILIRLQ